MKTKVIIFDKDGTLIDFDSFWVPVSLTAVNEILKKLGCDDVPPSELMAAMGVCGGVSDIEGVLCYGTYEMMSECMLRVLRTHGCDVLQDELKALTVDAYHGCADAAVVKPICDGLPNVLRELQSCGIKLAVVTADSPFFTEKCLRDIGIYELMDAIYTSDGIIPPKPDPYCIEDICRRFGVAQDEVVMVGDTFMDVSFAEAGGIRMIGVAKDEGNRLKLLRKTATVVHDVSYLIDIIE